MKRIFALLLCLLLCLPLLPAAAAEDTDRVGTGTELPNDGSGSCGEQVKWYFNEITGELKLTGSETTFNYWDDNYSCPEFASTFRTRIRSVTVSSSVTGLGRYLFWNLPKLREARIGSGVESLGPGLFAGCTALSRVVFSGCAPTIPADAFSGVTATVYYPADASWDSVRDQDYGGSLTWVPELSGGACGKLAKYDYYADGLLIVSGSGAMQDYGAENGGAPWAGALLREAVLDYGVTRIGAEAFAGCTGLTSLALPTSLAGIGAEAFRGCTGLAAFTLPSKVTAIGAGAFAGCTGLTEIVVYDSNTAFTNCGGLLLSKDETRLVCCPAGRSGSQAIPAGVTEIEALAFAGCAGLSAIEADAQSESFASADGVLLNRDGTKLVAFPGGKGGVYEAPASVTEIGAGAFAWCAGLSAVRFFGPAPSFAADCFRGTAAEIRYPADQPGWEAVKDQNYGGSLTWIASAEPLITAQPQSVTANEGTEVSFSVTATGAESYQWQYCRSDSDTWYNCSSDGCRTAEMTMTATSARNGFRFRCVVWNAQGSACSESAELTVLLKPKFTQHPETVSVAEGTTVSFTVEATGAESYQWLYRKTSDGIWYKSSSTGAKTPTLTLTATEARNRFQFRCKVTNAVGSSYSRAAVLFVTVKPVIEIQPEDVTVTEGSSASFCASAFGATSSTWEYRVNESGPWLISAEANTAERLTHTIGINAKMGLNGYQYRCVFYNSAGYVCTEPATLTVLAKPKITAQPQSVTAGEGSTVSFSVATEGEGLSYQWLYRKPHAEYWYKCSAAGSTTPTLTLTATEARNGFRFRCKVTSAEGGIARSEIATLTVLLKPKVTAQPQSVTANEGTEVSFSVRATGAESYQWQYRRSGTSTWYNCSSEGSVGPTMTMTATEARDGLQFRCKLTNAQGTTYTDVVTLTVK